MGNLATHYSNVDSDDSMETDQLDSRSHRRAFLEALTEDLSDDGDGHEAATILQLLIRSGQVHIVSYNEDVTRQGSSLGLENVNLPPKNKRKLNTKVLDKSVVSSDTKLACGIKINEPITTSMAIPAILKTREQGVRNFGGLPGQFSKTDRIKMNNYYLPSIMVRQDLAESKLFCGMYSQDGNQFLSAIQQSEIRVYDTNGPKLKMTKRFNAHDVGYSVIDTTFSPCGKYILYSSWSDNLHLCKVDDEDVHITLPLVPDNHRFCVFSVKYSHDGKEIVGGASDCNIYVYDMEANRRTHRFSGHEGDVNTVTFSDNSSQLIYSGGDDGFCKVWDRRCTNELTPEPVGVLAGHKDGITFIDSRNDGRHLISNSKDQTIKLWDIRSFSNKAAQELTKKTVFNQSWDYRWQNVPSELYKSNRALEGDSSVMTYRGHSVQKTLIRCRFSPQHNTGQRYIYTGCAGGRVIIYDVLSGKIVRELTGHQDCVRDVSWHPYKQEIISSSFDHQLALWKYSSIDEMKECQIKEPTEFPRASLRRSIRIAERLERENVS